MGTKIVVEDEKLTHYNRWLKKLKIAIFISAAVWLLPYFFLRGIAFVYMAVSDTDIAEDNLLFPTDPISQPAGYLSYTVILVIALITAYIVIRSLRYRNASGNPRKWLMSLQIIIGCLFMALSVFIGFIVLMIQGLIASYIFPYSFQ